MDPLSETDAWNSACVRLEDYLRAYRVRDRPTSLRLALQILDQAREAHAARPDVSPVVLTMEMATALTESWFARLAGEDGISPASLRASRGHVAYFASGADKKWPSSFLDPDPPAELLAAVRAASLRAGPELEFTSLVRREVDYGPMEDIARETWEKFSWSHVLRAFAIWVLVFCAAYFSYLHFFAP